MKRHCVVLLSGLVTGFLFNGLSDCPAADTSPVRANYGRPFETATRPAFLPLPPGAVEPAGWLRDWCLAARDGFTGHMDEYDEEFKRAWALNHKMTGERLDWPKGGWPYEGGGYWFDGLARLGYALHDETLIQLAKQRLEAVTTNMNPQGISFLWWLNRNHEADRNGSHVSEAWPMWANGLFGRALAGYYAGSADQRALRALETAYSGDRDWLRLGWAMSNPWPAFDTYSWTGNRDIAAALDTLFAQDGGGRKPGGDSWNRYRRKPNPQPRTENNDHVVHFLESTTPWALGYLWTGNRDFLDNTLAWHDLLVRDAMQPSGVPVADEYYGPTGAFRGTETCDVAAYIWSQVSLLLISGQGRLADRVERAFFNAGAATVARDFKTHVYFQTPNRIVDKSPPHPHGPQAEGNSYKPKHYPLCCTAALNRVLPWYVTHMWMATHDNGLAATCYGPCSVTALVGDAVPVEITCRTDYPFKDLIAITVNPKGPAAFPLSLRIPGWCRNPDVRLNGTEVQLVADSQGFVRLQRSWAPGDEIRLRLPMSASVATGRDYNAEGAPYASVSYGPLLFALPVPDSDNGNKPDPAAKYNYALNIQEPGLTVEQGTMPAKWNWPLTAPLRVRVNAYPVAWNPDPKAPRLPLVPSAKRAEPEQITLVPYGCTRFRVSMFPVTAEPKIKSSAIRRILFLGNSITLHGPKPDIGWTGNWGMAASSQDKDYVHLLTAAVRQHTGVEPHILIRNIADFERGYATYDVDGQMKDLFAFDPDLVVLAIGENVPALESDAARAQFKSGVLKVLARMQARRNPLVVVRSCFGADAAKDHALNEAAHETGAIFLDISAMVRDPANVARSERSFTHDGVAGHPGDRGMKALADAIAQAVLK